MTFALLTTLRKKKDEEEFEEYKASLRVEHIISFEAAQPGIMQYPYVHLVYSDGIGDPTVLQVKGTVTEIFNQVMRFS